MRRVFGIEPVLHFDSPSCVCVHICELYPTNRAHQPLPHGQHKYHTTKEHIWLYWRSLSHYNLGESWGYITTVVCHWEKCKDFVRREKQMWAIVGMQSQLKIKRWQTVIEETQSKRRDDWENGTMNERMKQIPDPRQRVCECLCSGDLLAWLLTPSWYY